MQDVNNTMLEEFVLLGFPSFQKYQNFLFGAVLLAYIICVLGNITIFVLIKIESSLHTPMYFFISIFTVLEIMFVSVTVPKLLDVLIQNEKTISFVGCFTQMYVFNCLGTTECILLSVMVFDRYLAITNPLRYSAIMTSQLCYKLAVLPWILGFTIPLFPSAETFRLNFCGANKINHFFCDLPGIQHIACSDPFVIIRATVVTTFISVDLPFFAILGFYIHIIYTVLKIKSNEGKKKAFSTCSSHLIVASLFYGSAISVYGRPSGSDYDKFLALTYTVVIPVVNPFIYTFRNREVKNAIRKVTRQIKPQCYQMFANINNLSRCSKQNLTFGM